MFSSWDIERWRNLIFGPSLVIHDRFLEVQYLKKKTFFLAEIFRTFVRSTFKSEGNERKVLPVVFRWYLGNDGDGSERMLIVRGRGRRDMKVVRDGWSLFKNHGRGTRDNKNSKRRDATDLYRSRSSTELEKHIWKWEKRKIDRLWKKNIDWTNVKGKEQECEERKGKEKAQENEEQKTNAKEKEAKTRVGDFRITRG